MEQSFVNNQMKQSFLLFKSILSINALTSLIIWLVSHIRTSIQPLWLINLLYVTNTYISKLRWFLTGEQGRQQSHQSVSRDFIVL